MQVFTATNIKNKLGDVFDAVEQDEGASVLIERNHRPVAMVLNAHVAEKMIFGAYAHGVVSRSMAMQQLGIEWYGDLLQRLSSIGIERPSVSAADALTMDQSITDVFASINVPKRRSASSKPSGTR